MDSTKQRECAGFTVFERITHAENPEDKVDLFCKQTTLTEIFAHVYTEIIQFLDRQEEDVLIKIRKCLFENLHMISVEEYDLVNRRKKSFIEDDIYVMGFSIANNNEHNRLKKVIKLKKQRKDDHDEEELGWLAPFVDMQNSMRELKHNVKALSERVVYLENKLSSQKMEECTISPICNDTEVHSEKSKHDLEVNLEECSLNPICKDTEVHSEKSEHELEVNLEENSKCRSAMNLKSQKIVKADVHRDINGNKQMPARPKQCNKDNEIIVLDQNTEAVSTNNAFRHTSGARKNILKGKIGLNPNDLVHTEGNKYSENKKLKAARNKSNQQTKLIYVGNLSQETENELVRSHLIGIGIDNEDIADLIELKTRHQSSKSYCVSLNTEYAAKCALDSSNWPSGIKVRNYYQSHKRQAIRPNDKRHQLKDSDDTPTYSTNLNETNKRHNYRYINRPYEDGYTHSQINNSQINTREGYSHTLGDYLDYGHRFRIPVWRKHY